MIDLIGIPSFLRIALLVAMETMHLHIAQFIFRTTLFRIKGLPINNLSPMRNCPGGKM